MNEYKQLLLANRAWAAEQIHDDPNYFTRHLVGQRPEFLWIGCSDSRVSPDQMTDSTPGGLFIHRNIANLVSTSDLNLMAVLQYAVDVLEVPHIIVCGHYGCGGITAAMDSSVEGPIDRWLANAREVHANHAAEIDAMPDHESKLNRLVECNVHDQIVHLARTATVQGAFSRNTGLCLHGWVYDMRDGHLKPLMEVDATTALDDIPQPQRVLI